MTLVFPPKDKGNPAVAFDHIVQMMKEDQLKLIQNGSEESRPFRDAIKNGCSPTDMTLVCKEKIFTPHKVVLCKNSPYFEAMFRNNGMVEVTAKIVELKAPDPNELDVLLKFMYTADLCTNNDFDSLLRLLMAAEYLQLDLITAHLWKMLYLISSINDINALLNISTDYNKPILASTLFQEFGSSFIYTNYNKMLRSLSPTQIKFLFGVISQNHSPFEQVQLILIWGMQNTSQRMDLLDDLAKQVRIIGIPRLILEHIFHNEPLATKWPHLREISNPSRSSGPTAAEDKLMLIEGIQLKNSFAFHLTQVDTYWHENHTITFAGSALDRFLALLYYQKDVCCFTASSNELARYGLRTKAWIKTPPMNVITYCENVAVLDQFIFASGTKQTPTISHCVDIDIERYDPASDSWGILPSIQLQNQKDILIQIATLSGKLYMFACTTNFSIGHKRCHLKHYCPESHCWIQDDMSSLKVESNSVITLHSLTDRFFYFVDRTTCSYWKFQPSCNQQSVNIMTLILTRKIPPSIRNIAIRPGPDPGGYEQIWVLGRHGTIYILDNDLSDWALYRTAYPEEVRLLCSGFLLTSKLEE